MELKTEAVPVNISSVSVKVYAAKGKNKDLLANASLTFRGETGEYFTISGFSIWNSKFGGLNVEVPRKAGFKFFLPESTLWRKLKKAILDQYDYFSIKPL